MYKGAIKKAWNYPHYRSQRMYGTKILKKNLYQMLDDPENTKIQLDDYIKKENERYETNCKYLDQCNWEY